jgi:hypothetical protein
MNVNNKRLGDYVCLTLLALATMTFSIMTHSIMTLSIMTLSIMTLCIIVIRMRHSSIIVEHCFAECHLCPLPLMLSVTSTPGLRK